MKFVNFIQRAWRPFSGLACAIALLWLFFVAPLANFIAAIFHSAAVIPNPPGDVLTLLFGCLTGLGVMRTTEKVKSKDTQPEPPKV